MNRLRICALLGLTVALQAAVAQNNDRNGARNELSKFKVEIDGAPVASANVESITVEDLVIDERETTTGADFDYREFDPGDAHFGSITIRSRVGKESSELYQWWLDASRGKAETRSIWIGVTDRSGFTVREYYFDECFPTSWDPGEYSPSSNVAGETLVCKVGRVELAAFSPDEDLDPREERRRARREARQARRNGFAICLASKAGDDSDCDSAWESCSGGSLNIEVADASTGTDQTHQTTPGHKYVDTLTLRGPLTSGRISIAQWINEVASGKDSRRIVVVKEILKDGADGKSFSYVDCFPTRYVFPAFSASGTGNLYEEVSVKPIRLDLQ